MKRILLATCGITLATLFGVMTCTAQEDFFDPYIIGAFMSQTTRPSFSIVGAGARAAGMGGAFTALADDASAASFNPAGLALLYLPEITLVGNGKRQTDWNRDSRSLDPTYAPRLDHSQHTFDTSTINFAALTIPLDYKERNLCIQLSYHRLIELGYEMQRQTSSRVGNMVYSTYDDRARQDGAIDNYSMALAYQLTSRLSVGASLSRMEGSGNLKANYQVTDVPEGKTWRFVYRQKDQMSGWNWSVGGLLRYKYFNIGGMYREAFTADYSFKYSFETNVTTPIAPQAQVNNPLRWPSSWTLGIAIKPAEGLNLTADYGRQNWSKMTLKKIGPDRNFSLNYFDLSLPEDTLTKDTGQWRYGAEWGFFIGRTRMNLRGGYFEEEEPFSVLGGWGGITYGATAGIGFKAGPISIDAAYQRRNRTSVVAELLDHRILENGNPDSPLTSVTKKQTRDQRVYLSMIYQFRSRDTFRKILRFLFVEPDSNSEGK